MPAPSDEPTLPLRPHELDRPRSPATTDTAAPMPRGDHRRRRGAASLRARACRSRATAACLRARRWRRRETRPTGRGAERLVRTPGCRRRRCGAGRFRAAADDHHRQSASAAIGVLDARGERRVTGLSGGLRLRRCALTERVALLHGEIEDVWRHHLAAHRLRRATRLPAATRAARLGDLQPLLLHQRDAKASCFGTSACSCFSTAERRSRRASSRSASEMPSQVACDDDRRADDGAEADVEHVGRLPVPLERHRRDRRGRQSLRSCRWSARSGCRSSPWRAAESRSPCTTASSRRRRPRCTA